MYHLNSIPSSCFLQGTGTGPGVGRTFARVRFSIRKILGVKRMRNGTSRQRGTIRSGREEGGKHSRYTEEQLEVLEKIYVECSNPDYFQRAQIMREQPILRGIDSKQLKVWFQNRRFREKQKRENCDLMSENRRLAAANKLLREENDDLKNNLALIVSEKEDLRNQVLKLTSNITTFDLHLPPESNDPELSITVADNHKRLTFLAEETLREFLDKVSGTAISWSPVQALKVPHTPGSISTIFVSSDCVGVAARACATMPFEPIKIVEALKDRPTWYRLCRKMNTVTKYPAKNGGTIEVIYTQYYAPTTKACARDFWTLRYTSVLVDGSFVVCEKSISGSDASPSSPDVLEFVRCKMLASGYMICSGEGYPTIHIVEHVDLEASSVPEVVKPLYESSKFVAKQMIVSALHHIELVGNSHGIERHACLEDSDYLISLSRRLCRGFNDAVSCFSEDGWTWMKADVPNNIIMSIKQAENVGFSANYDSVICVKASILLQNVFPANLVRLLKERRAAWMDFNFACQGLNIHNLSETVVLLGNTNSEDEALEVIRYEHSTDHHVSSGDLYHLQVCNGMEDTGFGACSELIFSPIDRNTSNDAALLCSGFRIIMLGCNNVHDDRSTTSEIVSCPHSLVIMVFQLPFDAHMQEDVVLMAQKYIHRMISCVKDISSELMPLTSDPGIDFRKGNLETRLDATTESMDPINLSLICQSYRSSLGSDIPGYGCHTPDGMLIHHHEYAILCFSLESLPVCLYANQSALRLLETTPENLHTIKADRILGGSDSSSLLPLLPNIMQQGYSTLPPGRCVSFMNHEVSYGQAVAWRVLDSDGSIYCLALAILGWSFI